MSGAQRRISELLVSSIKQQRNRFVLHESWTTHNAGALALQVRHAKKAFRKVEVILTESIKNLGAAGEIVEVAPGYARNYLCPQLKAMPAIEKYINLVKENLKYFPPKEIDQEELVAEKQAKEETEKRKHLDKMLKRLDSRKVVLYSIVKDKVNLRFPVTVQDIVREVKNQLDIELIDAHVDLIEDITTLGEFEVPLRLPPGLRLPGGRERLYLKIRTRRKNRIHNTETVLPKKGVLHPRYLNPDGTLKKKKKKVDEPTTATPDKVTE